MRPDWLAPPTPPPSTPIPDDPGLAEIWRNLFPWEDLNAKTPPERWLHLGKEILPTLSVLAASGATPKLLQADAFGSLITAWAGGPATFVTADTTFGAILVPINDPAVFQRQVVCAILSGPGWGPSQGFLRHFGRALGAGPTGLSIDPLQNSVRVGDPVIALPMLAADVLDRKDRDLGLINGHGQLPWQTAGEPASGTQATITVNNLDPNKTIHISHIIASLVQNGGAAGAVRVEVRDTNSAGTIRWNTTMGITATLGDSQVIDIPLIGVRVGTPGINAWIGFGGAFPGAFEDLAVATYEKR